jgi:hypothetical protein
VALGPDETRVDGRIDVDFQRLKRAITILMVVSHLLTFFWLLVLYFLVLQRQVIPA